MTNNWGVSVLSLIATEMNEISNRAARQYVDAVREGMPVMKAEKLHEATSLYERLLAVQEALKFIKDHDASNVSAEIDFTSTISRSDRDMVTVDFPEGEISGLWTVLLAEEDRLAKALSDLGVKFTPPPEA